MPGIVGIISREAPAVCRDRLAVMVRSMCHKPHYRCGTCDAQDIGVYAGWVAHPGSFAARQSTRPEEGSADLAFAGECYGESAGSIIRSYQSIGEDWVVALNGLFSGLLIDRQRGRAHLFNDRYGVERVYVHQNGDATYFASEAKALLRVVPETRSFDDEGVAEFLTFGCPIDGRTLFQGITQLEGGSVWTFDRGSCRKRKYFAPVEWERQSTLSAEAFQSEFTSTFKRVLPRYCASDSRIGISLTGGLDTRMIMACLPQLSIPPICYTYVGVRGQTLDAQISARVASECGLEHKMLRVGRDFLSDYGRYVDDTICATDGTAGLVGSHEIYLSAQAKTLASVRMTGNFGSEVMRGVSTLKKQPVSRVLIAADFHQHIEAAANATRTSVENSATRPGNSAVTFAAFREIPWHLFGTMASAKSQLTFRTPYLDNELVALTYRAPPTLRQSSASALTLIHDCAPRLSRIATDRAVIYDGAGPTYALRRLAAELTFKLDYLHQEAPPSGFAWMLAALDRRGMLGPHRWLPYRQWFRNELANYIVEAINDATTLGLPFWNRTSLPRMAEDHINGTKNYVREINAVLTLAVVDRLLLRSKNFG